MTPEEDAILREYLNNGKHMPKELRDFHDLKDLFKAIGNRDVRVHDTFPPEEINWRQGMIYVVDHFLWLMATHGYELRKVKGKIPRYNLNDLIEQSRAKQLEAVGRIINCTKTTPEPQGD